MAQDLSARARRDTIADALARAARRFRDGVALRFEDRVWSFAALHDAAGRIAHGWSRAGLRRGDRVVAFGRNSDAYLLAWLACCRGGFVHVPANYALTADELGYVTGQSEAALLISDAGLDAAVAALPAAARPRLHRHIAPDVLGAADDPDADPEFEDPALDGGDLAQLLYTSGTTAAPKGAMMTHRALLAEYVSCTVALEFGPADRAIAALPLYHSAQMHCFTMPQMLVGAETTLLPAPAAETVLRLIEQWRATSFFAPPTVWIALLRHAEFDRRDLTSLTRLYYGAAIMPEPVLQEVRRRLPGAAPFNCYGQSEIAPLATVLRPEEHARRPTSAGRPVLNVETRIVDAEMRDMVPGEQGEIVHRSPQLMTGYWGKPEETAAAFADGWFRSGDLGYMDEEGFLYVIDRVRDVINTGGVLVASREVEDALFGHPAVAEVAVVAMPDPKWIEAIAAVVVLREGAAVDAEALLAHARPHLAAYKLPKRIVFADALPKNTAGKVLKREIRQSLAGG